MIRVLIVVLGLLCWTGVPAQADSGDSQALNRLFEALKGARDASEGNRLTSLIWQIWNHPDDPETGQLMVEGRNALEKLDFNTALDRFDAVIKRAPELAEGWNKRATVYYVMGDFEASIRDIQHVLRLEPRHFGALAGLGMNYDALGNKQRALNAWRRALDANPHLEDAPVRIRQLEKDLQQQNI